MPIYEFRCQDCGHRFEELFKISEKDKRPPCPKCESLNTQKAISSFGTLGDAKGCAAKDSCSNFG